MTLTEGWTGPLDFTLLADGAAFDGSGGTVTLIIRDRAGALVDTTGDVAWISAASGTVRVTLDAADLPATQSPYTVRFRVVRPSGTVFFPSGAPDAWKVYRA